MNREVFEHLFGKGLPLEELTELTDLLAKSQMAQVPGGAISGAVIQFMQYPHAMKLAQIGAGAGTLGLGWFGEDTLSKGDIGLATGFIFGPAALARLMITPTGKRLVLEGLRQQDAGNIQAALGISKKMYHLSKALSEKDKEFQTSFELGSSRAAARGEASRRIGRDPAFRDISPALGRALMESTTKAVGREKTFTENVNKGLNTVIDATYPLVEPFAKGTALPITGKTGEYIIEGAKKGVDYIKGLTK